MTFVRPRARDQAERRGFDWLTLIGAADERDGRALDSLARSLRLIADGWCLVAATRFVLLGYLLGWTGAQAALQEIAVQIALALTLICDLVLLVAIRMAPIRRLSPNAAFGVQIPVVLVSGLVATLLATLVLPRGDQLIAATLGAALVAVSLFGRRRALSMSYCLGIMCAAELGATDGPLLLPALLFAATAMIAMAFDHRITGRSKGANRNGSLVMPGDLAHALLTDFEKSGHGWFWETDRQGLITYVSESMARKIGRKSGDLVGEPLTALIATPQDALESTGQRSLAFHFSARTAFSDIAVMAEGAQTEQWWSISGQAVVTPFGQFLGFRGSGSDLTETRRSQAEIARLAKFDSLTGLANRGQMMTTLEQTLAGRNGMPGECALLILDLDRFKQVNDTLGHPVGDALLQKVAQRLVRLIDSSGKVGRLGGDEFQIVLPGMIEPRDLSKLANAIIHSLSQPYSIDGNQVVIGASIGIALAPAHGTSSETLIRNADLALYAAKADGRGMFRSYAAAMHEDAEDRRALEEDLRHAIVTGGLHLEYQPVVSASTERITGFETLLRWNHPQRGPISPALFVPIAEDTGLIGTIGEWVLRTACTDAASWPEDTHVAVNVSPIQFANPNLPSLVMSALANAGLSASRLELEITESVFLADGTNTDSMFATLKGVGVRLALDDFGTGYSALGYLKTAPFDKIKIDQSFVRGAAIKGSRNAAIVKSIVGLAEALGMDTTAEGAETLDELDLIRSLGCSHVQGYVYGRPVDIAQTHALLTEHGGYAKAHGHKASREPRMAMLRTVLLRHAGHDYPARIRNISAGGALIEGITDVPAGTAFEVEFSKDLVARGVSRWSSDDRMGLEFDEPLDIAQLRTPVEKEKATSDVPRFYRENWKNTG